jgi:hypothetical protein
LSTFYSLSRIYGARYAKERSNTQSKLTVQTKIPVHRSSSKLMRQNTRHCLELHERIDCAQFARRIALPVVGPHTHHLGSGQSSHPTLLLAHHMASSTKTACRAPSELPPFSNVARHLFSQRVFGGGVSCSVEVGFLCVHKGHFLRGCHTPGERLRKFCVKNSERPATFPWCSDTPPRAAPPPHRRRKGFTDCLQKSAQPLPIVKEVAPIAKANR